MRGGMWFYSMFNNHKCFTVFTVYYLCQTWKVIWLIHIYDVILPHGKDLWNHICRRCINYHMPLCFIYLFVTWVSNPALGGLYLSADFRDKKFWSAHLIKVEAERCRTVALQEQANDYIQKTVSQMTRSIKKRSKLNLGRHFDDDVSGISNVQNPQFAIIHSRANVWDGFKKPKPKI